MPVVLSVCEDGLCEWNQNILIASLWCPFLSMVLGSTWTEIRTQCTHNFFLDMVSDILDSSYHTEACSRVTSSDQSGDMICRESLFFLFFKRYF